MKIGLLGYGTIGKGVVQQIRLHPEYDIEIKWILRRNEQLCTDPSMTADYQQILLDEDVDCIVECIGGLHPAFDYCLQALHKGKSVVSANKKMLANYYHELLPAAGKDTAIRFSAACGGGIPWIRNLYSISRKEEILGFSGIMNGTSNFILDSMFKENCSFEDALKRTQELGYAEADPSDDIDGTDTLNKMVLSSNIAFDACFHPEEIFKKGIRYFNSQDYDFALENQMRCVLLGICVKKNKQIGMAVLPYFVRKESIFYHIDENSNCFELSSPSLGKLELIGRGAGSGPTAFNVISDLLEIKEGMAMKLELKNDGVVDDHIIEEHFYIRCKDSEVFEDRMESRISSDSLVTRKITLVQLKEDLEKSQDKELFIAGIKDYEGC